MCERKSIPCGMEIQLYDPVMRSRHILSLFAGIALVSLVTSQAGCSFDLSAGTKGSGIATNDVRELPAFNEVKVSGTIKAEITVGGEQRVELIGDDNIVPLILPDVEDGVLRARLKPMSCSLMFFQRVIL